MKRRKPYEKYDPDSTPFSRRLRRSLQNDLRLVHRRNSTFYILGATDNVYTVTLSTTPTCDCPDADNPCKHILFLYIRVLCLPQNDPCIHTRTLSACQLTRLLSSEICYDTVAGASTRRRFREMYRRRESERRKWEKMEVDCSKCAVCLKEITGGVSLVACGACKVRLLRWRDGYGEEKAYVNMAAYDSEDYDEDEDEDDSEDDSIGDDSDIEESSYECDECKAANTGENTQTPTSSHVDVNDTLELGLSVGIGNNVSIDINEMIGRDEDEEPTKIKGKDVVSSSSSYEEKKVKLIDEIGVTNKMMQDAIRSLVELEEKKILFIDTSPMSVSQRAEHEAYCDMIREKYNLPRVISLLSC